MYQGSLRGVCGVGTGKVQVTMHLTTMWCRTWRPTAMSQNHENSCDGRVTTENTYVQSLQLSFGSRF
jgi:hypothetical protein